MKTLIKLILLGLIAGFTYKYLSDNNINVAEMGRLAYEWMDKVISRLDEIMQDETTLMSVEEQMHETQKKTGDYYEPYRGISPDRGLSASKTNTANVDSFIDAVEFTRKEKLYSGNSRFRELDNYARSSPASTEMSIEVLVDYLLVPAENELEKARVLFTWVASHIRYDDNGYNTRNYADCSPEAVLRNRLAVCEGYSNLLGELGRVAGLKIVKISGYSKGISYRPGTRMKETNHAWNAIMIDDEWRLMDATWAAGFGKGVNGRLMSVMQFDDYWFDTKPEEFIFSHLPEDSRWQLLDRQLSISEFEKMPYVYHNFFEMGFNGEECLPLVLNGTLSNFPVSYRIPGNITVVSMPLNGNLRAGTAMKIKLKSDSAEKMAINNNGDWSYMEKSGNEFTTIIRARQGEFKLMASFPGEGPNYHTCLNYRVN